MLPHKIYLSRAQTRSMSAYEPIGDPTGGAAYGEYNDPVTAAVVVGGNLIGADMQSDAASDAASIQAGAANRSADLQKQMFDIQNQQQGPYRKAGYSALNRMNYLLGLDSGAKTYEDYRAELLPQYTRTTTPASAQRTGFGVNVPGRAERAAAQDATPRMIQVPVGPAALPGSEQQMAWIVDPTWTQEQAAKTGAITTIDEAALDAAIRARMAKDAAAPKGKDFGKYGREFRLSDFQQDPGYAFRLKMGQEQAMRQANLGGGALSGNALAGLQDYTQGSASQEYTNAFNRYQTERGNIFNTLASIAGLGQTSLGQTTAASGQAGANIGQAISNAGSAQAAGVVGSANAMAGGLQSLGNTYALSNMLRPQTASGVNTSGFTGSGIGNVDYSLGAGGFNLRT